MATKTVSLLSTEALDRIHAESLRILESIGVRVENAACRDVLTRAGAKPEGQSDVLRLPAAMVEEAGHKIIVAAATTALGCCVNTSWLAAAGTMLNAALVAPAAPVALAATV